jgi:AraC-like DNA-binding protein
MSNTLEAISLNYTNIPVVSVSETNVVFGEFICTPDDRRNHYEPSLVEVVSKDMYLPNFSLRYTEGKIATDAIMFNEEGSGIDLPGSCMFIKGNFTSILPNGQSPLAGYHGTQNFKYDPDNQFRHIIHGDKQFQLLHISYKEEYLNYFLPENERWADQLKIRIRNRERVVGERPVYISAEQEMALQTIFNNPLNGKLGYLMLEAAVVQIILLQLDGLFRNYQSKGSRTEKRDEETALSLKEYLAENFLADHSLENLAQMFCMNTNKLMSVFKKQFHKSIFEYIQELRMRHAYGMLLDDMQVTEIARALGYKNPNHFSAAFKREFGVVPSGVKSASKNRGSKAGESLRPFLAFEAA